MSIDERCDISRLDPLLLYLYCASANLSTVILGLVDREKLHNIMNLEDNEKIVYTQVVGKSLDE